ncbi:hypothetical protein AAMO2058_000137900 [Amorphochlora amoebiformis]
MAASYGTVERSGRHHERKDIELQENGHYPLEKPRKPLTLTQSVIEWFKSRDGWPWLVVLSVAGIILCTPRPSTVKFEGWVLLAIFLATIVGAVVRPGGLGLGPLCIMAVAIACSTRCLSIQAALKDLGTKHLWLVVMAFFISRALTKSRLAFRIARALTNAAGSGSPLVLAYCFVVAEFLLSPLIPSVTARTGSIIFPLVIGIGIERDPDGSRCISSFLTLSAFQASAISSSMFVTAMAGNPIVQEFANQELRKLSSPLVTPLNWALGAIVPGIIGLLLTPLLIYVLHRPQLRDKWLVEKADKEASEGRRLDGKAVEELYRQAGSERVKTALFKDTLRDLVQSRGDVEGRARDKMNDLIGDKVPKKRTNVKWGRSGLGRWTYKEKFTMTTVVLMLFAWIADGKIPGFHMDPTTTAFAGVSVLILGRVLTWNDVISDTSAWSTLIWLAILSGLANALKAAGVIGFFSDKISSLFLASNMGSDTGFAVLTGIYVYAHYFFASCSAQMISMYNAFLSVACTLGSNPLGSALLLGYASNLMGGLTHYASGAAPVLFGKGYVDLFEWWRIGFVATSLNLLIFLFVGLPWMRFLGLF